MVARQIPTSPRFALRVLGLVPLWLVSIAILVEGFPRPPVSGAAAIAAFIGAVLLSVVALWKRWMSIALAFVSFFPLYLMGVFDEITTAYKTPFILVCAVLLTVGAVVALRLSSRPMLAALSLIVTLSIVVLLASHATAGFWRMTDALGYYRCFPDAPGCAPLPAQATPWWVLFFTLAD
jgi:hypothetical protein